MCFETHRLPFLSERIGNCPVVRPNAQLFELFMKRCLRLGREDTPLTRDTLQAVEAAIGEAEPGARDRPRDVRNRPAPLAGEQPHGSC